MSTVTGATFPSLPNTPDARSCPCTPPPRCYQHPLPFDIGSLLWIIHCLRWSWKCFPAPFILPDISFASSLSFLILVDLSQSGDPREPPRLPAPSPGSVPRERPAEGWSSTDWWRHAVSVPEEDSLAYAQRHGAVDPAHHQSDLTVISDHHLQSDPVPDFPTHTGRRVVAET